MTLLQTEKCRRWFGSHNFYRQDLLLSAPTKQRVVLLQKGHDAIIIIIIVTTQEVFVSQTDSTSSDMNKQILSQSTAEKFREPLVISFLGCHNRKHHQSQHGGHTQNHPIPSPDRHSKHDIIIIITFQFQTNTLWSQTGRRHDFKANNKRTWQSRPQRIRRQVQMRCCIARKREKDNYCSNHFVGSLFSQTADH